MSTAPGKAGVAVLRVSGPAAGRALKVLAGGIPEPRRATLRRLRDENGEVIDQALILFFAGPRSETGEDMAEFHVHGSRAVTAALLAALGALEGFRLAGPGEFARRAFDNGKLDLTAVEGLADLIEAETASQRRQALRQLDGALGRLYGDWRNRLVSCMALIETGIDFVDEDDVPAEAWREVRPQIAELRDEMARHLADEGRGERIREGAMLVVAGAPNVGKSTLLNRLARRDVAITSESPGTTRDAIEVRLDLGGVAVTAVDTAGLRQAQDAIEAEGMRRARGRIADADLVLWVRDPCERITDDGAVGSTAPIWHVVNKIDLIDSPPEGFSAADQFCISAKLGAGIDELVDRLVKYFRDRFDPGTDPVITRARHRGELESCHASLERALLLDPVRSSDLLAEELRGAAAALGRVVGRVDVEDVLDVIFRDFCIGK